MTGGTCRAPIPLRHQLGRGGPETADQTLNRGGAEGAVLQKMKR